MIRLLILTLFVLSVGNAQTIDSIATYHATKFKTILETTLKYHKDSIDVDSLVDYTFKEMLGNLDDYSTYYNERQTKYFANARQGTVFSLGVSLVQYDSSYFLLDYNDEVKEKYDLKRGWKLLSINGKGINEWSAEEINDVFINDEQNIVALKFETKAGNKIKKSIERAEYSLPSISLNYDLDKLNTQYVKLDRFSQTSCEELDSLIDKDKKLIIDLRDNKGGSLTEVVDIADMFLDSGQIVLDVKTQNEDFAKKYYTKNTKKFNNSVVVLINENSMSASEVLAGALQDYDRAVIVGETSYGKGTVQNIWNLTDSTSFKLTIAEYVTPSGRVIEKAQTENVKLDDKAKLSMSEEELHLIEKELNLKGLRTSYPIYETIGGRKIIGGGGIRPDIVIKNNELTDLTEILQKREIFYQYGLKLYLENKYSEIYEDFYEYEAKFKIENETLNDFAKYSIKSGLWNEEMFKKDLEVIRVKLKASLALFLYGKNAYNYCQIPIDKQLIEALKSKTELDLIKTEK